MRYVVGDISEAPEDFIVHGCNMQGKMNSGVAKALRKKFPAIFDSYTKLLEHPEIGLGGYSWIYTKGKFLGNLLTQEFFGYDKKVYADKTAIRESLKGFVLVVRSRELWAAFGDVAKIEIASPKIGCGRGGLDWETDVKPIYDEIETVYNVEFVIYDIPDQYSK